MKNNDQKYGFMREWMMRFQRFELRNEANLTTTEWFVFGEEAWELLQALPEEHVTKLRGAKK